VSKKQKQCPPNYTNPWTGGMIDMHGMPIETLYENVVQVQNDLQEKQLREKHSDLKKAYEDYQTLLKKYGFWDDITK
jgi:isoleucyl-tRNA synthetase